MHSELEAEKCIIGSIVKDPKNNAYKLGDIPLDAFSPEHREIVKRIVKLESRGAGIDAVTIAGDNTEMSLDVASMVSKTTTSANIDDYIQRVKLAYLNNQLINYANDLKNVAEQGEDADEFAFSELSKIINLNAKASFVSAKDVVKEIYSKFERMKTDPSFVAGISTGFADLDRLISGFHNSDLIVLAARPGVGKTALSLKFALNAQDAGKRVGIFSLEMSKEQLMYRIMAMLGGIDTYKIMSGSFSNGDYSTIQSCREKLDDLDIFIDDSANVNIFELRSRAKRLTMNEGLDIIIVDYLQLMASGKKTSNRVEEVSEISRQLKVLAKELNIPVIALSQLSRGVESRTDKRPMLYDLRDSGAIEQDADIVMFLYRDDVYSQNDADDVVVELNIAKHRMGSLGRVELTFTKPRTLFRGRSPEDLGLPVGNFIDND